MNETGDNANRYICKTKILMKTNTIMIKGKERTENVEKYTNINRK